MTAPTLQPGGPTPFNLTWLGDALQRRLVAVFEDFRLPDDNPDATFTTPDPEDPDPPPPDINEVLDKVSVYFGSVKGRSRATGGAVVEPEFPLVIVRPRTSVDDAADGAQRTIVSVDFIVGARRLNREGYLDVLAMVDRIRTDLLRSPTVEGRARLELPLSAEIGEDEAFPQWFGVVTAQFNIPQPVEEISCG